MSRAKKRCPSKCTHESTEVIMFHGKGIGYFCNTCGNSRAINEAWVPMPTKRVKK